MTQHRTASSPPLPAQRRKVSPAPAAWRRGARPAPAEGPGSLYSRLFPELPPLGPATPRR